jgi:hypothetical protein
MGDNYYPMSYDDYSEENFPDLELRHGHPVVPLEHVWESKIALQRPKNPYDLRLIARLKG